MPGIHDLLSLIATNAWIYGGSFLLVLSILVFVHEFGHYIVARWCGVRVETFSIGFGREIWGFNDKHGTRWKFSLVPLGGYVKMYGDVDPASARSGDVVIQPDGETYVMNAEQRKEAFFAKPVGKRAAIVFAGPAINYIFAVFILACLYMFYGQPVTPPQASGIIQGSAAEQAGFQPHDIVLSIDGKKVERFEDVRREVAVKLDTPINFAIERAGKTMNIRAVPARLESEDQHGFKQSRGFLGIISPGNGIDLKHVLSVEGTPVTSPDQARKMLLDRMGTTFRVELDRGETKDQMIIHPLKEKNADMLSPDSPNYNALVVANGEIEDILKHGPVDAVTSAVKETWNITASTLEAIGQMFTGTRSTKELGGIIRIGALAGDMAQSGILALITFTALLSINLGLINLFPIPMLDGGHLVFYVAEAARGSPLPERFQEYAFRLGLAILVGIMIFANLNDIMQLIL